MRSASNLPLRAIVSVCAIFWAALAVSPASRVGWALEQAPVVAVVLVLAGTYRALPLSNRSYGLIAIFVALHSIGAHYGYGYVPLGYWLRDAFDLSRNHYDRIVHFASGLLITYPIREIILRTSGLRGFWAYYLPLDVVIATSGAYEILEMLVVMTIHPEQGVMYLGTQVDPWDTQKDMAMAASGALLAMTIIGAGRKLEGSR